MLRSLTTIGILAIATASALAQSWSDAYERGLEAARLQQWDKARTEFQSAIAFRPEDQSRPTRLPGSITESRQWRNGSAYSPNFLAAYCAYRSGLGAATRSAGEELHTTAAKEFETLIAKGQVSAESVYFLTVLYDRLDQKAKREALLEKYGEAVARGTWKVDREVMMPEDAAVIAQAIEANRPVKATDPGSPVTPERTNVGSMPAVRPQNLATGVGPTPAPLAGRIPAAYDKYALIVGNGQSKIDSHSVPFAAEDANSLKDALVTHGGYAENQVMVLTNVSAQTILEKANELAAQIPENATVLLYFSGVGVNLDGKDYLAGVDSAGLNDSTTMVKKGDVFRAFMSKGAKLFAFFQVNRTMKDGRYFGMEIPIVGSISQAQATMPGATVSEIVRNGKRVGLYTNAVIETLAKFRSNRVPIIDFGWQVFYSMRTGGAGSSGGSSYQVPTLPVLTNLASDARF
ncbi:MAG: caspase family protein [Fimbriimonadaceae bacterium]|nr:caspase family protein [Fimbriimonadaceae bacterium]